MDSMQLQQQIAAKCSSISDLAVKITKAEMAKRGIHLLFETLVAPLFSEPLSAAVEEQP